MIRKPGPAVRILLLLFSVSILGGGCGGPDETPVVKEAFLMDTLVTIQVYGGDAEALSGACREAVRAMETAEAALTRYGDPAQSYVMQINEAAGREPVSLPPGWLHPIRAARDFSAASGGAFDLTIGGLVDAWIQSEQEGTLPSPDALERALETVDYRQVRLHGNTVYLEEENARLDLGGAAKGYIAGIGRDVLVEQGVQRGILNAGGDVVVIGERPDGRPWRIGIANPDSPNEVFAYVEVRDLSVVTSGHYQRTYRIGEGHYSHILSPFTGWPAQTVKSATVVAPDPLLADMLSTAIVVLGIPDGLELVQTVPGAHAVAVSNDNTVYRTPGDLVFVLVDRENFHEANRPG